MFKENPVLKGKDAERFRQRMKEVDEGKHRISKEEYNKSKAIYDNIREKQLYTLFKKWFDSMTEKEIRHFIKELTRINF